MTDKEKNKIKKDYKSGKTYQEIADKYSLTKNQVKNLIQINKWTRKSNRKKALKGNNNAKCNNSSTKFKNGNKAALCTGEYENIFSSVLDDDEVEILGKTIGTREMILGELNILTVRERRMLNRIKELKAKQKDMIITKLQKSNDTTSTEAQNTLFLINKIEDSLTRVQQSKKKMLDLLYKIECDDGAIVEKPNELEHKKNTSILSSINQQLFGSDGNG